MVHFIIQKKAAGCAASRKGDVMPTKKQKQAVIRQLLIPIFLIIAALLYQPVKGLFVSKEKPVETKADGGSLTVSYIDVGQGDATLIQKGNFSM